MFDYSDFHKKMNWCLECHGKGYKRVNKPYRDYNNRLIPCGERLKCFSCNGTGKFEKISEE